MVSFVYFDSNKNNRYKEKTFDYLFGRKPVLASLLSQKRNPYELYVDVENSIKNKDKKDKILESFNNNINNSNLNTNSGLKIFDFKIFKDKNPNIERSNKWMLKVSRRYHSPIRNIDSFFNSLKLHGNLLVYIDQIVDPQNFGSIIKSCIYFGVDHLVVNKSNKIPLSPALAYVSNGGSESIKIESVDDVVGFFEKGKKLNYKILTTFLNEDSNKSPNHNHKSNNSQKLKSVNLLDLNDTDNVILVLGSEDIGITELIKQYSTDNIKIDSFSNNLNLLDSLNVGISAGILIDIISSKLKKI